MIFYDIACLLEKHLQVRLIMYITVKIIHLIDSFSRVEDGVTCLTGLHWGYQSFMFMVTQLSARYP